MVGIRVFCILVVCCGCTRTPDEAPPSQEAAIIDDATSVAAIIDGWLELQKKGRDTQQFYDDFCFTSIDAPDLCKYAELQAERMKIRNRIGECEIRYWAPVR
jgi:hypothetical protein